MISKFPNSLQHNTHMDVVVCKRRNKKKPLIPPFVIEGYGLSGKYEFLPGISKMSHLQYMLWKEMRSNNCQSDRGGSGESFLISCYFYISGKSQHSFNIIKCQGKTPTKAGRGIYYDRNNCFIVTNKTSQKHK